MYPFSPLLLLEQETTPVLGTREKVAGQLGPHLRLFSTMVLTGETI